MAGGAGALAAAIGVDAWHPVVDRAAHDRQTDRHLDLMRGPVVFDVGNLRHPAFPDRWPAISGRAKAGTNWGYAILSDRPLRRKLNVVQNPEHQKSFSMFEGGTGGPRGHNQRQSGTVILVQFT